MKNYDVFISYSNKDKVLSDAICHRFEEDKLKCWMAPRDIAPGENWAESIVRVIPKCKVFFLIFSSNSNMSKQVLREVELAVSNGLTILPVRIEDIKPSGGMAYYLSTVHWIDAIDKDMKKKLHSLSKTVANTLEFGTQPIDDKHNTTQIPSAQSYKKRRSLTWLWIVIAAALVIGGFLYLNSKINGNQAEPMDTFQVETDNTIRTKIPDKVDETQSREYSILLDLEFDNEEDYEWVSPYDGLEETCEFKDEKIYIYSSGIDINYRSNPGVFIHCKTTFPQDSGIGLSGYSIYSDLSFESIYDIGPTSYYTGCISMEGLLFLNKGQYIDSLIYINSDKSAVYLFAFDEESKKFVYYACQIPEEKKDTELFSGLSNYGEMNPMIVESIVIANGSIKAYLDDNFETYIQNQDMVDEILDMDVQMLPEIIHDYNYE